MSLQVQIMLVLAGHPGGRATLAEMNADLAILAGAGPGWTQRIKRLASNAPGLDIFTEGYGVRDASGWQITDAGRKALRRMDTTPSAQSAVSPAAVNSPFAIVAGGMLSVPRPSAKVINIDDRRRRPRWAV